MPLVSGNILIVSGSKPLDTTFETQLIRCSQHGLIPRRHFDHVEGMVLMCAIPDDTELTSYAEVLTSQN